MAVLDILCSARLETSVKAFCQNRRFGRAGAYFIVLVNIYVYKLVVVVNEPATVDKFDFLHRINSLPRR
jgi:hypothetical protein